LIATRGMKTAPNVAPLKKLDPGAHGAGGIDVDRAGEHRADLPRRYRRQGGQIGDGGHGVAEGGDAPGVLQHLGAAHEAQLIIPIGNAIGLDVGASGLEHPVGASGKQSQGHGGKGARIVAPQAAGAAGGGTVVPGAVKQGLAPSVAGGTEDGGRELITVADSNGAGGGFQGAVVVAVGGQGSSSVETLGQEGVGLHFLLHFPATGSHTHIDIPQAARQYQGHHKTQQDLAGDEALLSGGGAGQRQG